MNKRVGVIVGRFQIAELHKGHQHLIGITIKETDEVIIFVGVHGGQPTERNPLSFELREAMLKDHYPNVTVHPILDARSDEYWSSELDRQIAETAPECTPVLYGSRDSFLESYCGNHEKRYVEEVPGVNATAIRKTGYESISNQNFLKGVIHATTQQRLPTTYPVIDVAIKHSLKDEILLGRKVDESGWRFPGGFVDPTDVSLEAAARREVREEMGDIEIDGINYLGSHQIDDRRYRGSVDGVISAFFLATYIFGRPQADDDLAEVRWFPRKDILKHLIPSHQTLGRTLLNNSQ